MSELELIDPRQLFVVKSNDIIQRARFSLSLIEQKIVLYLISKIQPNDENFKEYQFSVADFCACIGLSARSGANYNDVKDAIRNIRNKSMWIKLPDGTSSLVSWIEKARILDGKGLIQIRLDNDLRPYLLQLKEHYTQYQLIFTLRMKSRYSLRLYELIKSYFYNKLGTYKRVFTVDELRSLLDADKYTRYANFHADVLKVAIEECNKYSDIDLSYTQIKQGRKTMAIEFEVKTKDALERLRIADETDRELGTNQLKLF